MTNDLVTFEPTTAIDLAEVATWVVDGPETAALAVEYRAGIKLLIEEIDAAYRPHIAAAHKLHKGLTTELNTRLAPAKAALDALNLALGRYEHDRVAREAKARRDAEAAALRQAEADRAADAAAQRAKGNVELARDIEAAPAEEFMRPVVLRREEKTSGIAVSVSYEPVVEDREALLRYALQDDVPAVLRDLLVQPNVKGLQNLCDQMGDAFSIPGVSRVMRAPTVRSTRRS
jgi:hypothetical protein